MKVIQVLTVVVIAALLLGACSNSLVEKVDNLQKEVVNIVNESNQSNRDSHQEDNIDPLELSQYFQNTSVGEIVEDDTQIIWKNGDVEVIATKLVHEEQEEKQEPDTTLITTITVKNGAKTYKVKPQYEAHAINSISLSTDQQWLALCLFTGGGYTLYLIKLDSGEQINVNQLLEDEGHGFVESINAYNWSPSDAHLAFSFGDTSSSKIATYDVNQNVVKIAPYTNNYISTAYVIWSKEGDSIVNVSEKPSNEYRLYRYSLSNDVVSVVADLNPKEVKKLSVLGPQGMNNY